MAINTYAGERAYSINPRGGYQKLDFDFGNDTEVWESCSLQWKNQHYVFGGYNEKRQVSVVNGNRLERKGSLDFNFNTGGCTIINQQIIVLCFSWNVLQARLTLQLDLGSSLRLNSQNRRGKLVYCKLDKI